MQYDSEALLRELQRRQKEYKNACTVNASRWAFELRDLLQAETEIRLRLKTWWELYAFSTKDEDAQAWEAIEDLTEKLEDIRERIAAHP